MTKNIKNSKSGEEGIAIIIALGIFALILALGLNFATQSIVNDKIAQNLDNKTRSELLAKTAMNRFLGEITFDPDSEILYSTETNPPIPSTESGTVSDTELTVTIDNIDYQGNPETKWIYLYNKSTGEPDSEIIGRIAYSAVNPGAGSNNSDSMNYGGIGKINVAASVDSGYNAAIRKGVTEDTDLATGTLPGGNRILGRPGVNVSEIYLYSLDESFTRDSMLLISSNNADNSTSETYSSNELPGELKTITKIDTFIPYGGSWLDMETLLKAVDVDTEATDIRNRLTRKITLSTTPDPEAFWIKSTTDDITVDSDELYHRFNLARTDWDDITVDSFTTTTSALFTSDDADTDGLTIPWLKNWKAMLPGDTTSDTMKNQIIANLIDYNDTNSMATTDDEDSPSYTGNEKTPYINEINIEIEGLTISVPPDLHFALIRPRAATVELVNIYTGGETSAKITKVDIGYSYDYDGNQETGTFALSNDLSINVANNSYSIASQNLSGFRLHTADAATDVDNFSINSLEVQLKSNDNTEFYDYSFVIQTPPDSSTAKDLVTGGNNRESIYFDYEVNDPRQNLRETDWALIDTDTLGDSNSIYVPVGDGVNSDLEADVEPWGISTAYIRNAPMKSPWELGFIHRGKAWQTINLKKYDNDPNQNATSDAGGNAYEDGDANILDQIKMTSDNFTLGKVNLNNSVTPNDSYNPLSALFYGIRLIGANIKNISINTSPGYYDDLSDTFITESDAFEFAKLIHGKILDETDSSFDNPLLTRAQSLIGIPEFYDIDGNNEQQPNDATQEEIIGKFINLTKADGKLISTDNITILLISQSIKDVGGESEPIELINKVDGTEVNTYKGRFEENVDSVLSTTKALVTLTKNTSTNKWNIVRFEYIGE